MRHRHFSWARLLGVLRPLLLAALASLALAVYSVLPAPLPGTASSTTLVAQACGLGNTPTMLASKIPALLYPVTKDTPASTPIGIFAQPFLSDKTITFDEDFSAMIGAPPKTSLQWQWDFGDNSPLSYTMDPTHTYTKAGTYSVRVHIRTQTSDPWGAEFDSAQIHVIQTALPNPPVAKITANTTMTSIQENVILDASGSHSQDGSKLTYLWNFNDATTATGPHVVHQFPQGGKTFVALIVTDGRGAQSVATYNVQIQPYFGIKAQVSASAESASAGTPVSFDASKTPQPTDPANNAITRFEWDFGDGSGTVTTQDPTASHTFTKDGIFTVTVNAIDRQGAAAPAQVNVNITGGALNGGSSDNRWPLLLLGAVALLLAVSAGIFYLLQEQRKQEALAQQRQRALEMKRARRVPGQQGGNGGRSSRSGDGTRPPVRRPPGQSGRRDGSPPTGRW